MTVADEVRCIIIKRLAVSSEQPVESSVHVGAKKINFIASSDAIRVGTLLNCFFCRVWGAHTTLLGSSSRRSYRPISGNGSRVLSHY